LGVLKLFDPWRSKLCTCPVKYTINPYTGCSHKCLYCYATSYIGYKESRPKENLIKRLHDDLRKINPRIPIDMSLSSDPYPPQEKMLRITRNVLKVLLPLGLKVQITTKSNLFLLDLDLIRKYNVAVSVTITTLDNSLAKRIEPFAPSPKDRIHALEKLSCADVPFSVRIDPIIPFLNDDEKELKEIVQIVANIGAKHIVVSTYKAKPDNFSRMVYEFPELETKWRRLYYPRGKIGIRYAYLPIEFRKKLIYPVVNEARKLKLTYATCREALTSPEFFNAPSCDGTHLIPERIKYKGLESYISTKTIR